MFSVILGCKRAKCHIDPTAGIFGVLEEKLKTLQRESPILARDNTGCQRRRTSECNSDCRHAVYGIIAGGSLSWQNDGATL